MRAVDVLAVRDELFRDIQYNERFKRHVQFVLDRRFVAKMSSTRDPKMFLDGMYSGLRMSETFMVTEDMAMVADHAQESMPGEPLVQQDLPASHGFMWINGGIQTPDIRNQINSTAALVWASHADGVVLFAFAWKYDKKDEINMGIVKEQGRIDPLMPLLVWTGYAVTLKWGEIPGRQVRIKDTSNVTIDDEITVEDGDEPGQDRIFVNGVEVETISAEPSHELSWWLAAIRLMQQTVSRPRREEVPAKKVRRFDMKDQIVTIIELRRAAYGPSDGESHVEWSHRWVVRGHWRHAHAKDEDGNPIRRWVYINPYFKGPEDAPLLVRSKINFWKR